ncbi:hypothetical protein CDD82_1968 [Ophiocordyceps australis]|uniref:Uncharacterized protein n=1 Tax=Ophiocordyceps australis TaxID=1399860 RepID=A0A2C5X9B5_9HYPO|nr:hypothetical protein CDD82_1968 [Ophiocordyceps australis]
MVPFYREGAHCAEVLTYMAMAISMGSTQSGGPGIVLGIRPGTTSCPQFQGFAASLIERDGHWPSCQYTLPSLVGTPGSKLNWWASMVLERPTAYIQMRKGGLDLEEFKDCGDLRELLVSGHVSEVSVGEGYQHICYRTHVYLPVLTISGTSLEEAPSLQWCLDSGGIRHIGEDGKQWICSIWTPPKITP